MNNFTVFRYKLIYVFAIADKAHRACLKIGETTCEIDSPDKLQPNCTTLNEAARKRINQYTQTAGINYDLKYTEVGYYEREGIKGSISDKDVHRVLLRSGIKKKVFDKKHNANEWFLTDLQTAINAIKAAKEGKTSLLPDEMSYNIEEPVELRPEQKRAVDETKKCFRTKRSMLWNAKMRFGKTISALTLIKEMQFRKTIILTHRPVVNEGWFDDYRKVFAGRNDFLYGSKKEHFTFNDLMKAHEKGNNIIFFASLQDLRGSETVGGKFDKNDEIFSTSWDLVIIDEAHEGTQTDHGEAVTRELLKGNTKLLCLSGTPFNLLDNFTEDSTYVWDYIMEQKAKAEWDILHPGDPNPYACMPKMNIWTYDLGRLLFEFKDEDITFNFREFFRTNAMGSFVHENDVKAFLNLMTDENDESLYPFSKQSYRQTFSHSLWVLPGVKAAKALSALMKEHPAFQFFHIVNVAGNGDDDEENINALEMVNEAIANHDYTITLSCGRLTTGVSVPEWTAVMMLSGSYFTSASSYMQTIFRVQTAATINGKTKEECFVFDFAPDRTLKVLAEAAKVSAKPGQTGDSQRHLMQEFLNFCPVIGIKGSTMEQYNTDSLLQQLKNAYAERAVRNGFEDTCLYNEKLLNLSNLELDKFQGLKKIIGVTRSSNHLEDININDQGLTGLNKSHEQDETQQPDPPKNITKKPVNKELEQKKKERQKAISILRGISIRMPLMIYGAEIDDKTTQITIDNFDKLIDDLSWQEFMPNGVTKDMFRDFKKYYDQDVFIAAGKKIRRLAKAADKLSVEDRIEQITKLFDTFKNPDKETVLTPWRVVNMHMAQCLGGWCFYDNEFKYTLPDPNYVEQGNITSQALGPQSKVLEINSKTGLYPLYVTYSIFRARMAEALTSADSLQKQLALWDLTLKENIFVVCKTPMAKSITKRTLAGFRNAKVNARYFDNLINQIKEKPNNFIKKMHQGRSYWKTNNNDNMNFTAIVGNPPYMKTTEGTSDAPVYHLFMDISFKLCPLVSLITPGRFLFNAGKTPKKFNDKVLNDDHFKVVWYKPKSTDVFPNVDIKGGICVFVRNKSVNYGKMVSFTHYEELNGILRNTIEHDDFSSIMNSIILQNKFNLEALYKDHPNYLNIIGSDGKERRLTTPIFTQLDCFSEEEKKGDIRIIGLVDNKRTIRYIKRKYVEDNGNLNKYKVIVPKSNGTGAIGEILSTPLIGEPLIGEPLIGYTQSFIGIGSFDSLDEAKACLKYVKTQFARTLLGVLKVTQDNNTDVWRFVPLQDFTAASDIDWSKTVAEIDEQLFRKYQLSQEECDFIRQMIKPMD